MEQIEKQFITSYQSTLAKEGKEICKEVDSIICNNDELMIEKANTYCMFIAKLKSLDFDPKLVDKCKKYLIDMNTYSRIKRTLEDNVFYRKMV